MLIIRNDQMDALRRARRAAYVRDLAARARREAPLATETVRAEVLHDRVDRALDRAVALGFVLVADQARYALLVAAAGDEAVASERARAVLEDHAAPGHARLDRAEALLLPAGAR